MQGRLEMLRDGLYKSGVADVVVFRDHSLANASYRMGRSHRLERRASRARHSRSRGHATTVDGRRAAVVELPPGLTSSSWTGCVAETARHLMELWHLVSAKGAVDDDPVQSALKKGELPIVE